jgi:hypothetical protein
MAYPHQMTPSKFHLLELSRPFVVLCQDLAQKTLLHRLHFQRIGTMSRLEIPAAKVAKQIRIKLSGDFAKFVSSPLQVGHLGLCSILRIRTARRLLLPYFAAADVTSRPFSGICSKCAEGA